MPPRRRSLPQDALLDLDDGLPPSADPIPGVRVKRAPAGRCEREVGSALAVAGLATSSPTAGADRGAAALARSLARAVDVAEIKGDLYAMAQVSGRLLDVLRDLRLTPSSRQESEDDQLSAFFDRMAAPLPGSAEVRDPA